jgi:hypothetical protein
VVYFDPRLENLMNGSTLRDFLSVPTSDGEHTQVPTTLQPDGAQVVIEIAQFGAAPYFQMQPVVAFPVILCPQVVDRLFSPRLLIGGLYGRLSLWAGR